MKKAFTVFISFLLCLLALSGCSGTEAPAAPQGTVPVDTSIHTAVVDDSLTDRLFENVIIVGDADYEYERNAIWCEATVNDLKIFSVDPSEDYAGYVMTDNILYQTAELKPSQVVVLCFEIPEGFPNAGMTCTVNGVSYSYVFGYNGRDGGMTLIEADFSAD